MKPKHDPKAPWILALATLLVTGLAWGLPGVSAASPQVYVDDDYDDAACTAAGHDWQVDCFDNIQDGLDEVSTGGTVFVRGGNYREQLTITTEGITLRAASGQSPKIITANDNYNVLVTINATNVTLQGLALESPDRHTNWTGVEVRKQSALLQNLRINADCQGWPTFGVFAQNQGANNASGLRVVDSTLACGEEGIRLRSDIDLQEGIAIRRNTIAGWEKGIFGEDAEIIDFAIERNIFAGEPAYSEYAISLFSQSHANAGQIVNNLIYGWQAGAFTIVVGSGTATSEIDIINNTLVDNDKAGFETYGRRGAILIRGCNYVGKIKNNIIADNNNYGLYGNFDTFGGTCNGSPATDPRSAYGYQSGFEADYNDVYDNGSGNYSGVAAGGQDISQDPVFVDAAADDYRLQPTSPCIDQGTDTDAPAVDLVGTTRPQDGNGDTTAVTDIGAYEFAAPDRSLEIVKQLEPPGNPGRFNLQVDGVTYKANAGDGDGTGKVWIDAGVHTVRETAGTNASLGNYATRIECKDNSGAGSVVASANNAGPLDVNVGQNDNIVCTIRNTRKTGQLEVIKSLDPTSDPGKFNLQIDGATKEPDAGNGGRTGKQTVNSGVHTVGETAGTGTSLADYTSRIQCRTGAGSGDVIASSSTAGPLNVNVAPNADILCTITNVKQGSITIAKDARPNESQPFTFTGDLGSFSLVGSSFYTFSDRQPGVYQVRETVPSGWDLTNLVCNDPDGGTSVNKGSATANIDLDAGEDITCTYTNVKLGRIIVEKQTQPAGDPGTFTFTGDLSGDLQHGEQLSLDVPGGTYTTQEAVPAGWDLTQIQCEDPSGDSWGNPGTRVATFKVQAGETVKCTFTNVKRGKIIVEKQAYPDGATQVFSFSGDVRGNLQDGGRASKDVVPGTYRSTESVPSGWVLAGIRCEDPSGDSWGDAQTRTAIFQVSAGETVTCTFINGRQGTISIAKDAIPNSRRSFDFSGGLGDFALTDSGQSSNAKTFGDRQPDNYPVRETVPLAWDLTNILCFDRDGGTGVDLDQATATIDFDANEAVVCIFENTAEGDMYINKTASAASLGRSEELTYRLEFSNQATMPAPGVVIEDPIPAALTNITFDSTLPVTPTGTTKYTWDAGTMAPGESGVITVRGTVRTGIQVGTTFTNTAEIRSRLGEATPEDNKSAVRVTVINLPPVAINDVFGTAVDTTLNSAPLSVLDNDLNPDDDPLTAVLDSQPSNGTLTFLSSGTFTYNPNGGFRGIDKFTYHANDGSADSNVATVSLYVGAQIYLPAGFVRGELAEPTYNAYLPVAGRE